VGKLAGFGIANIIEVRTVKDRTLTHFRMNLAAIKNMSLTTEGYEPDLVEQYGTTTNEGAGTCVVLSELNVSGPIKSPQFKREMARRFGVLSDMFRVQINGEELSKEDVKYEHRFPNEGVEEEEIAPGKRIKWWIGFTKQPIKDEISRGVSVIVRGRLAQEPFFFNLSGGTGSQHGLQYLAGEVQADYLDEYEEDLIISGRLKVRWDHPDAAPLLAWGQKKVKNLLKKWGDLRTQDKIDKLTLSTNLVERIKRFTPRERDDIMKAVNRLSKEPALDEKRFREQVEFLLRGYESQNVMDIIHAFDSTSPEAYADFIEVLKEWDVVKAVNLARILTGNIKVIDKFGQMIKAGVREKPDMHDLLIENPWLIDPQWDFLEHEATLDQIIQKYVDKEKSKAKAGSGATEPDFFCLAGGGVAKVVEIKRPGERMGTDELDQTRDYVLYLRRHIGQTSDPRYEIHDVEGYLIVDSVSDDLRELIGIMKGANIFVIKWDDLLRSACHRYQQYYRIVKERAPSDDPRMEALRELESQGLGSSTSSSRKSPPDKKRAKSEDKTPGS
jgi:hypothetical protein